MPDSENKLFTKSLPAFLARTQFGQILERVSKHHDRFLVTKNGEATAVILGVNDFLQAIAPTPEALAALHEQARRNEEHSVILTSFAVAVDGVQIPERRYRYTWRSAVPTSHCRCTRTTMPQSA
jgi:prevent-host-death family protein